MNPYEVRARLRKVEQLAFVAWGFGFTAADLESFDETAWGMLAMVAKTLKAGPVTRLMVKDRLYTLENTKAVAA